MHRILFVDDEPMILTGLRRMLRSQRHEWDMEFAVGGVDALESLRTGPFDVVVSDARMPGMEGSELLEEVRRVYPDTVRMILSGQCSRDSVLQCVGVAHQFLSKPCDAESLKDAIQRVCIHRDYVVDHTARATISQIASLPSRGDIFATFMDLVSGESSSLRCLTETIGSDVALSMKVIQLVSSGFFGSPQRVVDVHQAVELLGVETIRVLASLAGVFRPRLSVELDEALLRNVNEHSLAVAEAAKRIAESATDNRKVIAQAHVAGMFHEVGPLIWTSAVSPCRATDGSDECRTYHSSGFCASRAGAYLAALWGLPAEVVRTVASLRNPGESDDTTFTSLTAVHVAHACLDPQRNQPGSGIGELNVDYLKRINCAERLNQWREMCHATQLGEVLQ